MAESNLPKYISFNQLREEYGIPRASAYRYMKEMGMPRPYQLGQNSVRFKLEEIERWLADRPHADIQSGGVAA